MTAARQDGWNNDEDVLLAEVVLRHIREGSTQLAAFEEVGQKLSRTSAACGFRWNSYVRKQYKSSVEFAKKQRKGNSGTAKGNEKTEVSPTKAKNNNQEASRPDIPFKDIISYLTEIQEVYHEYGDLRVEKEKARKEMESLRKEVKELKERNKTYKEKLEGMEKDYKALIEIMDRAREIVN